jgi:hypothetical protein
MEKVQMGRVAFALPLPLETTPPNVRTALFVRAYATVTGRCPCGATRSGDEIRHEDGCPAISRLVEEAVAAGGVQWVAVTKSFLLLEEFKTPQLASD